VKNEALALLFARFSRDEGKNEGDNPTKEKGKQEDK
jgi:hypothetical protein